MKNTKSAEFDQQKQKYTHPDFPHLPYGSKSFHGNIQHMDIMLRGPGTIRSPGHPLDFGEPRHA